MFRALPWIILGGIALIAAIVVAHLVATFLYLQSPERVVRGAFERLLDARSVQVNLLAEEEAPNGASFKVDGAVDISTLIMPIGALSFSFQTPGQAFYGNGEARLEDGQIFLRFAQIAGLPGVLPGALQSIWAGVDVGTLLLSGQTAVLPAASGSFTEDDLQAFKAMLRRHPPLRPASKGTTERLEGAPVLHYPIEIDRQELIAFMTEVHEAVSGAPLTAPQKAGIERAVRNTPGVRGEAWIAKGDGTLRAVRLVFTRGEQAAPFHVTVLLSRYNEPVSADAPLGARSLFDLLGRLFGPSLTGSARELPFALPLLPKPGETVAGPEEAAKRGERDTDGDGLSDVAELFYNTSPVKADTDGDGISDGMEVARGTNPRGSGGLFDFGL